VYAMLGKALTPRTSINRPGSEPEPLDLAAGNSKDPCVVGEDSNPFRPEKGSTNSESSLLGVSPVVRNLRDIRSVYLSDELDELHLGSLMGSFLSWVREPTALAFYDKARDEYFFRLASKRGNSLYRARVQERLEDACSWMDAGFLDGFGVRQRGREVVGNVLFMTLTYNPDMSLGSRRAAWLDIMMRYNRFISAFRKRYGRCWVLRSIESTCAGYPHIHLLVVAERPFPVFSCKGRYRVKGKRAMESLWSSGFIDAVAVEGGSSGVLSVRGYLAKDILKQARADLGVELSQSNMTLALNWLFRKQSFGVSGAALRDDLIKDLRNSNRPVPVVELVEGKDLVFLGVVRLVVGGDAPFFSVLPGAVVRDDARFEFLRDLVQLREREL
jgi:hypothetical protein